MHWSNDYIGTPIKALGSTREGVDCWGLVVLVYREVFGLSVPAHRDHLMAAHRGGVPAIGGDIEAMWEPTDQPKDGDVLHMWAIRDGVKLPNHCGLVAGDPARILHAQERVGAVVVDLRARANAWRPIQFYRRRGT